MKSTIRYDISIEVDHNTGTVQAAYLQVRKGKVADTKEFDDGNVFADYDNAGNLLGVEILGRCKASVFDKIVRSEPTVTKFLKRAAPREMVLA